LVGGAGLKDRAARPAATEGIDWYWDSCVAASAAERGCFRRAAASRVRACYADRVVAVPERAEGFVAGHLQIVMRESDLSLDAAQRI